MTEVGLHHVQAAQAILARIALSAGDAALGAQMAEAWRRREGIADGTVEDAAAESAGNAIEEIADHLRESGEFSLELLREYLEREYQTAWMVGWICRARKDLREGEQPAV